MQVGDIVHFRGSIGIILDTGIYVNNCDVLVKWNDETVPIPEKSRMLDLLTTA